MSQNPEFKVLIIDDEPNLRNSLAQYFKVSGIQALVSDSGEHGKSLLEQETVDAIVVDLRMKGMSGLDFLLWLHEEGPSVPAIMISAHGDLTDAVAAMKNGACDYVIKPFNPEELVLRLRQVVQNFRLSAATELIKSPVMQEPRGSSRFTSKTQTDISVTANSPAMRKIYALIQKIASAASTVMITGESGTGKEVIARNIHAAGLRANGPFVPINIGGIPEQLLESELFGFEKSAFTGADRRKTGLFELANGGTLFLDELGEMPLALQVKLLRVLQDRSIMRLGGTRAIPLDLRIICATNRNLEELLSQGRFREDLFYRLNVIRIHLPPLRERGSDVLALADYFLRKFSREMSKDIKGLDESAQNLLQTYNFPGNVRELENALERAVLLSDKPYLSASDFTFLGKMLDQDTPAQRQSQEPITLRDMEKRLIQDALVRNSGHRERSAAELGISRRTLLNKMKEYEL